MTWKLPGAAVKGWTGQIRSQRPQGSCQDFCGAFSIKKTA